MMFLVYFLFNVDVVCVGPGPKPRRHISHDTAQFQEQEETSRCRSLSMLTDVRRSRVSLSPGELRSIQVSLDQLQQSLSSMQLLKEQMDRETETRIEQLNMAVEQMTSNFRKSSIGRYLDSLDMPIKSCDRNNNRPVNDDDIAQKPTVSSVQKSPWKTSSAPLLEQETPKAKSFNPRLVKARKSKGKKGSSSNHDYVLVPFPNGIFGDVLQKKPNGKPKYTDVMTVIHQGTANHKVKSRLEILFIKCKTTIFTCMERLYCLLVANFLLLSQLFVIPCAFIIILDAVDKLLLICINTIVTGKLHCNTCFKYYIGCN